MLKVVGVKIDVTKLDTTVALVGTYSLKPDIALGDFSGEDGFVKVAGAKTVHVSSLELKVIGAEIGVTEPVTTAVVGVTIPVKVECILGNPEGDDSLVKVQGQSVTVNVVGADTVQVPPFVLKVVGVEIEVTKLDTTVVEGISSPSELELAPDADVESICVRVHGQFVTVRVVGVVTVHV